MAEKAGMVTNLDLPPGNYIKVGEPLFTMVTDDSWRAIAYFKETVGVVWLSCSAVTQINAHPGCFSVNNHAVSGSGRSSESPRGRAIAVGLILSFLVIDVLTRKTIRGSSD
jgi:hypothetical protein